MSNGVKKIVDDERRARGHQHRDHGRSPPAHPARRARLASSAVGDALEPERPAALHEHGVARARPSARRSATASSRVGDDVRRRPRPRAPPAAIAAPPVADPDDDVEPERGRPLARPRGARRRGARRARACRRAPRSDARRRAASRCASATSAASIDVGFALYAVVEHGHAVVGLEQLHAPAARPCAARARARSRRTAARTRGARPRSAIAALQHLVRAVQRDREPCPPSANDGRSRSSIATSVIR